MAARTITVSALSTPNSSHSGHTKPSKSSSLALPRNLLRPLRPDGLVNSFIGGKLSFSSSSMCSHVHKRQCSTIKVSLKLPSANPERFSKENMPKWSVKEIRSIKPSLSLPSANPERFSKENMPKWSVKAIRSFGFGELQARKVGCETTTTEGLLMGILVEGTNFASQFLRANGITLSKVKKEYTKKFWRESADLVPAHPPVSESALRALDWAIDEKLKSGKSGEVTPSHMLLGIWSEKESEGHKLLATLGFDDEKAKEVAKFASKDYE